MDGIDKRRAGELQRLIRGDIRVHQNHGKKYQEYDADSRSHEWIFFQQKVRGQPAEHQQTKRNNQGVLSGLLYYSCKIDHSEISLTLVGGAMAPAGDLYQARGLNR